MMLVEVETVFVKSVLHQLYGTPELHFQIRMAGIRHLNDNPIESYVLKVFLIIAGRTAFNKC